MKQFEGEYVGNDPCDDPGDMMEFSLTVDSEIPNRMWFARDELYFDFTTSVRFDIPTQTWRGRMVKGQGQMLVNKVSFYYSYTDTVDNQPCLIEADLQGD